MGEEKLMTLKPEVVEDRFVFDDREFVVINKSFLGTEEGVALGEVVLENGEFLLKSLSDKDYKKALKYYSELIELFSEE